MRSELPNRFLKRQLDIGPGEVGRGLAAAAFHVLDQIDLLLGAWLILAWSVEPTFGRVLLSVVFVVLVHQLVSVVGYALGMRATVR